MIVPLPALVAFLAPVAPDNPAREAGIDRSATGIGATSIGGLLQLELVSGIDAGGALFSGKPGPAGESVSHETPL
jgi:hypothetical protein